MKSYPPEDSRGAAPGRASVPYDSVDESLYRVASAPDDLAKFRPINRDHPQAPGDEPTWHGHPGRPRSNMGRKIIATCRPHSSVLCPALPPSSLRLGDDTLTMPLYRGYNQPDNPAIYRAFDVDAPTQHIEYSARLKAACLRVAGPEPDPPSICPRCGTLATFVARVCFKYGIAGAWNMKVSFLLHVRLQLRSDNKSSVCAVARFTSLNSKDHWRQIWSNSRPFVLVTSKSITLGSKLANKKGPRRKQ